MSEDLVVSIFDENNEIEEENLLLGKVGPFLSDMKVIQPISKDSLARMNHFYNT